MILRERSRSCWKAFADPETGNSGTCLAPSSASNQSPPEPGLVSAGNDGASAFRLPWMRYIPRCVPHCVTTTSDTVWHVEKPATRDTATAYETPEISLDSLKTQVQGHSDSPWPAGWSPTDRRVRSGVPMSEASAEVRNRVRKPPRNSAMDLRPFDQGPGGVTVPLQPARPRGTPRARHRATGLDPPTYQCLKLVDRFR